MPDIPRFPDVDRDAWRARVVDDLNGRDFDRALRTRLLEGIDVAPLYGTDDLPADRPPMARASGFERGFAGCPRHDRGDAASVAAAIAEDVAGGAGGVWLRFGRGDAGVEIQTGDDLRRVLAPIVDSGGVALLDPGDAALPAAVALSASSGGLPEGLLLGADPIGVAAGDAACGLSLDALIDEASRLAARCVEVGRGARAFMVSTVPYHDAGADAAVELGYAAATALAYLRAAERHDVSVADASSQLALRFAVTSDLFLEVAKLRAARRLLAKVVAACEVDAPSAPVVHACSSRRSLAILDRETNALRVTSQVLAAALGGADLVTAARIDEVAGPGDDATRRLARNTPSILAEECGIGEVDDPLAGSYYVEALTDALARAGWEVFRDVERDGGMRRALESGAVASTLAERAADRADAVAKRRIPLVGVSVFARVDEESSTLAAVETATSGRRGGSGRGDLAGATWDELVEAAAGVDIAALGVRLAIGDALDGVALPVRRDATPFEELRARVAGSPPAVFLAGLGGARDHKPQADFVADLVAAGGVAITGRLDPGSPEEAIEDVVIRFKTSGTTLACVAGDAERVAEQGPAVAAALKAAGATLLLCTGRPGDDEARLRAAGVDHFVHRGCDTLVVLSAIAEGRGRTEP